MTSLKRFTVHLLSPVFALNSLLIFAAFFSMPQQAYAWKLVNNTDEKLVIRVKEIEGAISGLEICPPWTDSTGVTVPANTDTKQLDPSSPKYDEILCNPKQQKDNTLVIEVLAELSGSDNYFKFKYGHGRFYCRMNAEAAGTVYVREQSRPGFSTNNSLNDNIYCISEDNNGNEIDRSDFFANDTVGNLATMDTTNRDVRFLVAGDPQYFGNKAGYKATADKTLGQIDTILGNSLKTRGAIISGDLTQDATSTELNNFIDAFKDNYPRVYEGLGNHDVKDNSASNTFSYPENVIGVMTTKARSTNLTKRRLGGDLNTPHYSWDWHDVHFIQANVFPANDPHKNDGDHPSGDDCKNDNGNTIPCKWQGATGGKPNHDPMDALDFIKEDLDQFVGDSGRPVIIIQHYGFEGERFGEYWWTQAQRRKYWNAIKDYNVIAIFTGHLHREDTSTAAWDNSFVHLDEYYNGDPADDWESRIDGQRVIPSFNAAAARGAGGTNCDDNACNNGVFLDATIDDCNVLTVNRKDSNDKILDTKTVYFDTGNSVWGWTAPTSSNCMRPQPDNESVPTDFKAAATASTSIRTNWTDLSGIASNTGTTKVDMPTGFIVRCWETGFINSLPTITDGVELVSDSCNDGAGIHIVKAGTEFSDWKGLKNNTQYKFDILAYSNTGTNIDYNINASAIVTATTPDTTGITILHDTVPDRNIAVTYTISKMEAGQDILITAVALNDSIAPNLESTYSNPLLTDGTYILEFISPDPSYIYSISCVDQNNSSNVFDSVNNKVSVTVGALGWFECLAVAERRRGQLVIKRANTGVTTDFFDFVTFEYQISQTINGTTFGRSRNVEASAGNEYRSDLILAGPFEIKETPPPSSLVWTPSTISCVSKKIDLAGPSVTNQNSSSNNGMVDVILDHNERVICTFTSTAPQVGNFNIVLNTLPDTEAATQFTYDIVGYGKTDTIILDNLDDTIKTDPRRSFNANVVPTGAYTVVQTSNSRFNPPVIECVGDNGNSFGSGNIANINLDIGENITCTFTNKLKEAPRFISPESLSLDENITDVIDLKAIDDVDSEGNGLTYSLSGGDDIAQFDINSTSGEVTFITAPDYENPSDNDKDNVYDLEVKVIDSDGLDESITITVTVLDVNDSVSITFVKNVVGGSSTASDWIFNIVGGTQGIAHNGSESLNIDSYTITESGPAGYTVTDATGACSLANNVITLDVMLSGGTCTITNTRDSADITFVKNVVGGSSSASDWSFNIAGGSQGIAHNSLQTLDTGSYTITESGPASYNLTGASGACSLSNGVITLNVTTADDTCTITNTRDTGDITFIKSVDNGIVGTASSSDWSFNISGVASGIAHNGQITVDTGNYTLTESGLAGYSLTNATGVCSLSGGTVQLTVNTSGGTCMITNTIDDSDGDGFNDDVDNCPLNANPTQDDLDGDNIGDVCDPDDDNDTVPDVSDNCPTLANTDQTDANGDGYGDVCVSIDTTIQPTSEIGDNPAIGDNTTISKDTTIGDNATIGDDVTISKDTNIGDDVNVGDNTTIAKDAIIGDNVVIGDNVKIGNNVTIADGSIIPDGTVIENGASYP